jgi:Inorganic pyrophosphatase/exopolyphosphatase
MNNYVVTSGGKYIDIDAYAACIAYAVLLKASGLNAKAVTTAPFNESVPNIIKEIDLFFDDYIPQENDKFILVDVSNPTMFDRIVKFDKISRVIDHHIGYEEFWKEKELRGEIEKSEIEFIGSVCTNIYEKFVEENKVSLLNKNLCKLLIAGILDNTLNLKASITTKRDINAYNDLVKIGKLDDTWTKEYFTACEEEILNDLETSIINDIKNTEEDKNLPDIFGQLTIFNSDKVLEQIEIIKKVFKDFNNWMMNVISLIDGRSYIITDSEKAKKVLETFFNSKFENDILILDKFMLRKEIIKKASDCKICVNKKKAKQI